MTPAGATVMALYLSPWLRSVDVYIEIVEEAVHRAREVHARRDMDIDESLRESCRDAQAAYGSEHEDLLAWARAVAADYEAGRVPADPYGDDAASGVSYKGIPATCGDLRAAYEGDLPDGGSR
ncbi:hypothetical protein [Streptomyces platensis]|uniref:hypothetical protein n=1 Tax=Streptomyces platensis TaxID=58346 RepID=UPI00331F6688